jgi:hypothetical protein
MSPKEKAMELVWKYLPILIIKENPFDLAKQCALIAVDEVLSLHKKTTLETLEYWDEVKNEIEKL